MSSRVLVTGCAGFIGFHLSRRLLKEGWSVVGVDNVNDYYHPQLKLDRLSVLKDEGIEFHRFDLVEQDRVNALFEADFKAVVHLAAQAGVRYSLENPHAYISSNITAFLNILEACRHRRISHLLYASSSSVYGSNTQMPFSVEHRTDHPLSLYGATKKANEVMAHAYGATFGLPSTGLRFFTVYGPWGRPDMALYLFARAILAGQPIDVFNRGEMRRDFTFVDDVVESLVRLLQNGSPTGREGYLEVPGRPSAAAPARVLNVGSNSPVELGRFIELVEENLGKKAKKNLLPMQPGDVPATYADVSALEELVNCRPTTTIEAGVKASMDWFSDYMKDDPVAFRS